MAAWPDADYCPCGWSYRGNRPHKHAERLRKFWRARLAKNPPVFVRGKTPKRERRREREMEDA